MFFYNSNTNIFDKSKTQSLTKIGLVYKKNSFFDQFKKNFQILPFCL